MAQWFPPTKFQQELVELIEMLAADLPDIVTEEYVSSVTVDIREEPHIAFESIPDAIGEMYGWNPPAAIVDKVKKIALMESLYVVEIDEWEAKAAGVDRDELNLRHFPSNWDRNTLVAIALELATDPTATCWKYEREAPATGGTREYWHLEGEREGMRLRLVLIPCTGEIVYFYPLDKNRRFTSFKSIEELYG
jgi:hypothetical protein